MMISKRVGILPIVIVNKIMKKKVESFLYGFLGGLFGILLTKIDIDVIINWLKKIF